MVTDRNKINVQRRLILDAGSPFVGGWLLGNKSQPPLILLFPIAKEIMNDLSDLDKMTSTPFRLDGSPITYRIIPTSLLEGLARRVIEVEKKLAEKQGELDVAYGKPSNAAETWYSALDKASRQIEGLSRIRKAAEEMVDALKTDDSDSKYRVARAGAKLKVLLDAVEGE